MSDTAYTYTLKDHFDGIEESRARALRVRRSCNFIAIGSAVLSVAIAIGGEYASDENAEAMDTLAGFLFVLAVIFAVAAQVSGASAERLMLEFQSARLPVLEAGGAPDPAGLRILASSLPLRQTRLLVRQRMFRNSIAAVIFTGLGLALLAWFLMSLAVFLNPQTIASQDPEVWSDLQYEALAPGLFGAMAFGWGVTRFQALQSLIREDERLEVELELIRYGDSAQAARARKLFLLNHQDLQKYYTTNRFNARFALLISIFCVLAGIGLTIWTMLLVIDAAAGASLSKHLVAGIGAANAVMVNVVAAVVLRVHSTVASNVNAFHDRLVRTHEAFLSNVIAAEIDEPVARRETLSRIAEVIGARAPAQAPSKGAKSGGE